jgi:SNF2 family DNA or RNA helicase
MLKRSDLHDYQTTGVDFISDKKKVALWLGLGLGKTASALTAVLDLHDSCSINKVLIVAPLRVANSVWHKELAKWEHLQDMTYSICTGTPQARRDAISKKADIYVINRENIFWLVQYLGAKWDFDCLIIDEASSFKNHGSKRFKALKSVAHNFDYVVELTATPATNGYLGLWAQSYLLDAGKRLGKNITAYRNRYFTPDYSGFGFRLNKGADTKIKEALDDVVLSQDAVIHIEQHIMTRTVTLPEKVQKAYDELKNEFVLEINSDVVEALTAAALGNKLLQMCNGAVYGEEKSTVIIHDEKIEALKELIEEAGEPVMVAYNFKHDRERLLKAFPKAREIDKEFKVIDDWQAGKVDVLLAHPASSGHGLDGLQLGGRILIWFGMNWDLELYLQLNGRIARQGQKDIVQIVHIIVEGGQDELVVEALENKAETQKDLIDFMKKKFDTVS